MLILHSINISDLPSIHTRVFKRQYTNSRDMNIRHKKERERERDIEQEEYIRRFLSKKSQLLRALTFIHDGF